MDEQAVFDALKYRVEVDAFGTREYYNNAGHLHRTDGPAVVGSNGYMAWWQNGQRHRVDGPAIVYPDGSKEWHQHGHLHRIDGPAIEFASSPKHWYINGKALTEAEFNQRVKNV